MNEPLPPYSGDTPPCPKCQYEGATTQYREHGQCVHGEGRATIGMRKNERLHRECMRCGHAWDEALAERTSEVKVSINVGLTEKQRAEVKRIVEEFVQQVSKDVRARR